MASINKKLCGITMPEELTTVYTAPAGGTIIKTVSICNKSDSFQNVTIKFGGLFFAFAQVVESKNTLVLIDLDHVLSGAETIECFATTVDSVDLIVSGKESV